MRAASAAFYDPIEGICAIYGQIRTINFPKRFGASGPVILPDVHVRDPEQARRNIEVAKGGGCPGVFLINHDFEKEKLVPIIKEIRQAFPDDGFGVNLLASDR
jgi:hypothetical protein